MCRSVPAVQAPMVQPPRPGDDGRSGRRPRAVTLGGGHGQAAMLAALGRLDCDVTAVVSIADDGGCSGRLRAEHAMPPPGDLRRCLTTMAIDRALANAFEERLESPRGDDIRRCAGNLALFEAYLELGSLSAAVDWAAHLLRCRGQVLPAADEPGRLTIYDRGRGVIEGESVIEREARCPVVVGVHGPRRALPRARAAILGADLLLVGPGSFVTSTLAAVMTADLAEAVVASPAARVMVQNLVDEPASHPWHGPADQVRLLRDHLCIGSGRDDFDLIVLADGPAHHQRVGDGSTSTIVSPVQHATMRGRHDATRVAAALTQHFGLAPRSRLQAPLDQPERREVFGRYLDRARARLRARPSGTARTGTGQ